jgi:hypothetical protein
MPAMVGAGPVAGGSLSGEVDTVVLVTGPLELLGELGPT